MSARHTRRAPAAAGNTERLLVEGLASVSGAQLQRECGLDGAVLEDADVSTWEGSSVRLAEVALRRVDLSATRLRALSLIDVLASSVNAANGSWSALRTSRVTFERCNLVGLDAGNGELSQTTFRDCKLDLANLRMATLHDVVFSGCSLRATDFYGATLRSVSFTGCELHETDFDRASLETVDLRGSSLADIRGIGSLSGAIVDAGQLIDLAPSLAGELGIRVQGADG
jgi:uncharacterized protein YjbI with pentapeptide repeats